jgi:aminoglycoside 3-N-acetyltransferase
MRQEWSGIVQRQALTQEDLVEGFRTAGIDGGDVVFVHASISKIGHIDGGMDAVIDALLDLLGAGGTLAMPGFTFQLFDVQAPVFDVRNTPCWASKLYERFRTRMPVCRSHHVTHSLCAVGARARELTAAHSASPCGPESPFVKLAGWGAKILLIGASHNASTTLHAVEEQERVPYMRLQAVEGATIIDEDGRARPIETFVHNLSHHYDFNRLNETLTREGIQRESVIGRALVRCVDAGRMFAAAVREVRRDPGALMMHGDKETWIPVTAGEAPDDVHDQDPDENGRAR